MGTMLMSRYFDYGTFSLVDRVGAVVALVGVVLVVQPDTIFRPTGAPAGTMSQRSHETPKQLKGVVCGLVGVAGGVVSSYINTKFILLLIVTETDGYCFILDCPGNHSSNWTPSTSSDKRELFCLGCCSCHYSPRIYPAFTLADELERSGITGLGWNSWHTYGGLTSITCLLSQMSTNVSDRSSYLPPAFRGTRPLLPPL